MSAACPKCGYMRQAADTAPVWQCPACGIAIEKYVASHQAAPLATPVAPAPEITLASRVGSAAPDIATAWVFAWCWMHPLAWRVDLTAALGQIVLMEFLVVHSSGFFAALVSSDADGRSKLGAGLLLSLFYLPFAAGFAFTNGSWWPLAAFAWLILGRLAMVANSRGWSDFEKKRLRFYWGNGAALYILFAFVAVFLPVPAFGFAHARVPFSGWAIPPQDVICWGFLYFSAVAAMKLLENPRWIASIPDPEATAS